ncbi:DUF5677 domain-containing protein [Microvirga massiliensis]|uniref:DUF5677 domain-containing protein n=1 Tax=Microvirga massiliensis TaxID=1033741 RepID=UPI00065F992A|nr:DUF5677 domain-containing protein [Microvirga massiliensis]
MMAEADVSSRFDQIVTNRIIRSLSRAVDLFDDCIILLENERLTSSLIIARAFFEQAAYTTYILDRAEELSGDLDALEAVLVDLDNSSEQRRRLFAEDPDPNQAHTEAAVAKYGQKTPAISTAELIKSLQRALTKLGDDEGKARLMYSTLSEWSHPTLFSVVHAYTKGVPDTPTSIGMISAAEARRAYIAWALSLMLMLYVVWTERYDTPEE